MDLDFETIFREPNGLGIDYLVVGGLAVNFHWYWRHDDRTKEGVHLYCKPGAD
jgi:hypothetical protein